MKKCIIGLWQAYCSNTDMAANFASAAGAVDAAARARCDFLCLPETFLTGYGNRSLVKRTAIPLTDRRLLTLARHAHRRKLILIAGLNERRPDGQIGNTMAILSGGHVVGTYSKTMLTGGDIVQRFREVEDTYRSLSRELTLEEWRRRPRRSTYVDNAMRLTSALQ